eukprot:4594011-Ditylum_brightwellii.AAC.2
MFHSTNQKVEQVMGSKATALGMGLILLKMPNSTFPIIACWPSYYMPDNPQCTISQGALKQYNYFPTV